MIGERLTELRIKHNMTQEDFAEYMCVTRQSVSKWETDKTYPDVEKLIKIAELYEVTLDYLVRGQEEANISNNNAKKNNDQVDVFANDVTNNVDIDTDSQILNNGMESIDGSVSIVNRANKNHIKVCMAISFAFILITVLVIMMFLIQNPWFHSDISEQSARVDKVYGQISLAQVSYENEDGEKFTELIVLDTANVREGDYINAFSNEDGELYIDYGFGIICIIVILLILNIIVALLLVKELNKS